MRHRVTGRKLSRTTKERKRLLRNMVASLVLHEKITTALGKAKEAKKLAERLITKGKQNNLAARRQIRRFLPSNATAKIIDVLSPKYKERKGGYTRIIHLGQRRGDNTKMAILELV